MAACEIGGLRPPPNSPQEPTCGRSLARRFRGSNSATRGVAQPRAIRPHAAQRKNVRRSESRSTGERLVKQSSPILNFAPQSLDVVQRSNPLLVQAGEPVL